MPEITPKDKKLLITSDNLKIKEIKEGLLFDMTPVILLLTDIKNEQIELKKILQEVRNNGQHLRERDRPV